jgi:hypothetical protein
MKIVLLWLCVCALPVLAGDNLLKNGGFETENPERPGQPADWGIFTETAEPGPSAIAKDVAHEGKYSYKLLFEGKADKYIGVSQNAAVQPGQKMKFVVFVRNATLQRASYGQLGLEWKDAAGQEVSRDIGEGMSLKNTTTTDWTRFELIAPAPLKSASVTAVLTLHTAGSTDGSILIDDVRLEVIP